MKVLEELYYHTREDSRYISELKIALLESGIYEDDRDLVVRRLVLKDRFRQTDFYKKGRVILNKRVEKSYNNVRSFDDLSVKKRNYIYTLSSGESASQMLFSKSQDNTSIDKTYASKDIKILDIQSHIIRFALSQNRFFHFDNISRYFPNIRSILDFINDIDYLGGLEIVIRGASERLLAIDNFDYFQAIQGLLSQIELEIKANLTEYEGSDYTYEYIRKVFKDKEILVNKNDERANNQEELVADKDWYVYNANYGTSEEKKFIELFARRFEGLKERFDNIYLIRNERELKIYNKLGQAFEPDFLLFCKRKNTAGLIYQVFIEPKGRHLIGYDKWKEDFLRKIDKEQKTMKIDTDEYIITGVPFYNYENENEFAEHLMRTLG